ncbi:MAG: alpha/beta hydrolase [Gemmatimonadetes bacterium]|nr:alpha/beta hydrolase [Gemmatimonadota bacterium]
MTRRFIAFALGLACTAGAACGRSAAPAAAPEPAPPPAPLPRAAAPRSYAVLDSGPARVNLLLATTRRAVSTDRPGLRYGPDDGDSLQFAAVSVNVPSYRMRGTGELPRTGALRDNALTYRPDPQRDFYVTSTIPVDSARFVQRLAADLATTRSRDLLVFVHGYNVSFEDAAVRAAQMAADLNFDGTVLLFSWPSAASVTAYVRDQQSARNAGFQLLRVLRYHAVAAQPDRIHLLGHSMGAEVIGKAMTLTSPADLSPRLSEVVLAAPDVDSRVFRREILPRLTPHAERITLYASSDDDALRASGVLNGAGRLGLGGDSLVVIDGMDTVDATRVTADVLGHTLFGNQGFLADLALLLADGKPPAERRLLAATKGGLTFYRFRGDRR